MLVKHGEDNTDSPELPLLKSLPLAYHHGHFLAATLDFTSFSTTAFLELHLLFLAARPFWIRLHSNAITDGLFILIKPECQFYYVRLPIFNFWCFTVSLFSFWTNNLLIFLSTCMICYFLLERFTLLYSTTGIYWSKS